MTIFYKIHNSYIHVYILVDNKERIVPPICEIEPIYMENFMSNILETIDSFSTFMLVVEWLILDKNFKKETI